MPCSSRVASAQRGDDWWVCSSCCSPSIAGTLATRPAAAAPPAAASTTDYWVVFKADAELADATRVRNWKARGTAVVEALSETADTSQAVVRARLRAKGIDFDPYYIANAIYVHDGSNALADELAARPEVERLVPSRTYSVPELQADAGAGIAAVEWGIHAIHADDVWSTYGVRGDGIVVANIDTGVQFDHPALARQYRGNTGSGFDHNYNWYDPSGVCGVPSAAPCDNNGHGTHTMGTMVGDDGAGNQIGVAPGARWIAAKGCETRDCSDFALLAAGQWILAPTDLAGNNPRPDLRPNIVNNSWGGAPSEDFWYKATVEAWRAAGIFPAASIGNVGPTCDTDGAPAGYVATYGTGAFDINGNIAPFSSRGPGENGEVKPNLAAPGVDVRSAVPGGGYSLGTGTSMASPHTAGTVALIWSGAPALIGDVAATEGILDGSAVDVADLSCGGTDDDNNVWGEGKLDAFAAVTASRTQLLDDFNRANGSLGGSWRGLTHSAFYRIASNRLDVQAGGPIYWNTEFGPTQEAFVTLSTIDSRSVSQGLLLKVGAGDIANAAAITVTYDARARGVTVSALRANARSWTLYPRRPVTFANGAQLGARVTNAGTVQIRRNGSVVATVVLNAADQAYFNSRGGKIGISMLAASSSFLDDFGGGTTAP